VEEIWGEIKSWITKNAPHLLNFLAPGASIQDIEAAEAKLNLKFPQAFKEFYLIHNGQIDESECLVYQQAILSLKRIVSEWQTWMDLLKDGAFIFEGNFLTSASNPGIRNDWWNPKWIPITRDGCGDSFCIDMDPTDGGKSGQIISMWYDIDSRELMSDSFENWITQYASELSKGNYIYEERLGIWKKEDQQLN
jgi:cell wall assembly regulator SMI1